MIAFAVARHELLIHLRRRSFLLSTAMVPAVGLMVNILVGTGAINLAVRPAEPPGGADAGMRRRIVGYVDESAFVARQPAPPDGFVYRRLADEQAALRAVDAGEVSVAYLIGPDYPNSRSVTRLSRRLVPSADDKAALDKLLRANLWPTAHEEYLSDLADPGRRIEVRSGVPSSARAAAGEIDIRRLLLPATVAVLLYSTIFMLSSFLLQSVTTEKESRVMEVLLTSMPPVQLLAGKLLGLAILGLLQLSFWGLSSLALAGGGVFGIVRVAAAALDGPTAALAVTYFLLGYGLYASLMAAVGAVAPTIRESGPLTLAVLAPAWSPFLMLGLLIREPSGPVARLLSMLPPTAPLVMLLRVMSGPVPPAELAVSLLLLLAASASVLWLAARLFRATMLLSGTRPSAGALWAALRA